MNSNVFEFIILWNSDSYFNSSLLETKHNLRLNFNLEKKYFFLNMMKIKLFVLNCCYN